jgi:hypothetical protein
MDLDWNKNEIHVIQKKTGHPLILPFEAEIGTVLANYILSGRPETDSPYVFLEMFETEVNRLREVFGDRSEFFL